MHIYKSPPTEQGVKIQETKLNRAPKRRKSKFSLATINHISKSTRGREESIQNLVLVQLGYKRTIKFAGKAGKWRHSGKAISQGHLKASSRCLYSIAGPDDLAFQVLKYVSNVWLHIKSKLGNEMTIMPIIIVSLIRMSISHFPLLTHNYFISLTYLHNGNRRIEYEISHIYLHAFAVRLRPWVHKFNIFNYYFKIQTSIISFFN